MAFRIKKNIMAKWAICRNTVLSVLFLAIVVAKVLVISATLLILSFPLYLLPVKAKLMYIWHWVLFYAFMSTILWISGSKMTFHFSVTSEADASWMVLQQNLQNSLMHEPREAEWWQRVQHQQMAFIPCNFCSSRRQWTVNSHHSNVICGIIKEADSWL